MNSRRTQRYSKQTQVNSKQTRKINTTGLVSRNLIDNNENILMNMSRNNNMVSILNSPAKTKVSIAEMRSSRIVSMATRVKLLLLFTIILCLIILSSFMRNMTLIQVVLEIVLMAVTGPLLVVVQKFLLSTRTLISSLETNSDVFEEAVQLSLCDSRNKSILAEEQRSRYAKFLTCYVKHKLRLITRDRGPSRIPVKKLRSILQKSKNLRSSVRKYIRLL